MTIAPVRGRAAAGASAPAVAAAPTIDFGALLRKHRAWMTRRLTGQLGNQADAEDAFQNALIKAWQWQGTPKALVDNTIGWVYRIASMEAHQIAKKRSGCVPVGDWAGDWADRPDEADDPDPDRPCMGDEATRLRVMAALDVLHPRQRQVVELHCLAGVPIVEVARRIGMDRTHVWAIVNEAFNRRDWGNADSPVLEPDDTFTPEVIAALTPCQRQVARLCLVDGLSGSEAGRRLGVNQATVSRTLTRVRAVIARRTGGAQ